jgi:hypothetical protein
MAAAMIPAAATMAMSFLKQSYGNMPVFILVTMKRINEWAGGIRTKTPKLICEHVVR